MTAIVAAGDRSERVRAIQVPTLVIHGEEDTMLAPAHGLHTHELIVGSTYIQYPGMGHGLPKEHVSSVVDALIDHLQATSASVTKADQRNPSGEISLPVESTSERAAPKEDGA